jgi:hypothetical protein
VLGNQALKPHGASGAKKIGPDLSLLEWRYKNAVWSSGEQSGKVRLAHRERQVAHILTIAGQHIEGVKLDLLVMLPAVQGFEVRNAVGTQHHGFAIKNELLGPDTARGVHDPRVPVGPIVPVAGEQVHPVAIPLDDHAEAVVFDLVQPLSAGRDHLSARRNAGLELSRGHAADLWTDGLKSVGIAPAMQPEISKFGRKSMIQTKRKASVTIPIGSAVSVQHHRGRLVRTTNRASH